MSLLPENISPFDDTSLADPSKGFIPAVDVYEKDDAVVVETPLAGVDPKDVTVAVDGDTLTITGKSEHRTEVDEKNYIYKEVRYGAFQRKVQLPKPVLGERASMHSEHGLLKITFPKK
jgi:HSP20 family protein